MIVIDTHVLLWWVGGDEKLPRRMFSVIEEALGNGGVIISSISAWEIAMLVRKGKLALAADVTTWLETVGQTEGLRFVPVDNAVAVSSLELPGAFHDDPADRIIVALARRLAVPLVTADEKIRRYPHVATIW